MSLPFQDGLAVTGFRQSWKTLPLSQKVSVASLLFIVLLIPISILATFSPVNLFQHAASELPTTPPYTPTATPTPKPTFINSVSLDGTTSCLEKENPSAKINFAATNSPTFSTVEGWFKAQDLSGTNPKYIIAREKRGSSYLPSFEIYIKEMRLYFSINTFAGYGTGMKATIVGNTPIYAGKWYHFAAERDNTKIRLFIDGHESANPVEFVATTLSPLDTNLTVGCQRLLTGTKSIHSNFFKGQIDEIRISNIARYSDNFTPQISPFSDFSYPALALWHFDSFQMDPYSLKDVVWDETTGRENGLKPLGNISFTPSTVFYSPLPTTTITPTYIPTPTPTTRPIVTPTVHSAIIISPSKTNIIDSITKNYSDLTGLSYGNGFNITASASATWQLYNNQDATYATPGGQFTPLVSQGFGFYESSGGITANQTVHVRSYVNNNRAVGTYKGSYLLQQIYQGKTTNVAKIYYTIMVTSPPTPTLAPRPTNTPTQRPTPTLAPINRIPVILTTSQPAARYLRYYRSVVAGYDLDKTNTLTMKISGVPTGLSYRCSNPVNSQRAEISCIISGFPLRKGTFSMLATLSDNKGGKTSRNLVITVK